MFPGDYQRAYAGRLASHHGSCRHVMSHYGAGSDQRAFANLKAAHDYGARADRGPAANARALHPPVAVTPAAAVGVGRARAAIIDEHDAVADEYFILDIDTGAHERMAGNLAAPADDRVTLHFDERADRGVVADRATVEIDEWREPDVVPQGDVIGNRDIGRQITPGHQMSPYLTATMLPPICIEAEAASST